MAFFESSRNVILDGPTLRAECRDRQGGWHQSELNLSKYLGNSFGNFEWGLKDFEKGAKNAHLDGSILHASLAIPGGGHKEASLDLNDHITNRDGQLQYVVWRHCSCSNKAEDNSGYEASKDTQGKEDSNADPDSEIETRRLTTRVFFEGVPAFQYSPLSKPSSIRLARIDPPGDTPDIVHCSLIEVDLGLQPRFAALSYTWGNPFPAGLIDVDKRYTKMSVIGCNGQSFEVGQNLYDALRQLRRSEFNEPREQVYSKTELISKAEKGLIRDVERLLRDGADVTARDRFGETALHYAAEEGHIDVVKALVYAGSDIRATDSSSRTPLACAKQWHRGSWEMVIQFLSEALEHGLFYKKTCLQKQVTEHEYFWIDAICINQSDQIEKSAQVAMMSGIYRAASSVVAWLGPERSHSADSTEEILRGVWILEGARISGNIHQKTLDELVSAPVWSEDPIESETATGRLIALEWLASIGLTKLEPWILEIPLFRRTWFERAWILQEVLLPREITVVCGPFVLPWDIFIYMSYTVSWIQMCLRRGFIPWQGYNTRLRRSATAVSLLGSKRSHFSRELPPLILHHTRTAYQRVGQLCNFNALSLSRNACATDPRDKVFAIMSFSALQEPTDWGLTPIVPDYTQSTKDLYIRVSKSLFEAWGPAILSLSGMHKSPSVQGLPSWVVDLQTRPSATPLGVEMFFQDEVYRVSPGGYFFDPDSNAIQTPFVELTSTNALGVVAFGFDSVGQIARPGLASVGHDLSGLSDWIDLLSGLKAPPKERLQRLWRTLLQDNTAKSLDAPPHPEVEDADFQVWLLYRAFVDILDLESTLRSSINSRTQITCGDISRKLRRNPNALKLLSTLKKCFIALDIPLGLGIGISALGEDSTNEKIDVALIHRIYDAWVACEPWAGKFASYAGNTDRRLLRTAKSNMLGTGPEQVQAGDVIALVRGAFTPYILRKAGKDKYRLVGEAYLYGYDHEAQNDQAFQSQGLTRFVVKGISRTLKGTFLRRIDII